MNNTTRFQRCVSLLVPALILSLAPDVAAQEKWTTISDDSIGGGALGMCSDATGTWLFDANSLLDEAGNRWALARMSTDGGNTWDYLDTFLEPESNYSYAFYAGIACGADLHLYAGGVLTGLTTLVGGPDWLIRESPGPDATWETTDRLGPDVTGDPASYGRCQAIQVAPWGEVFAAGTIDDNWTVRRKNVGDGPYETCDSFLATTRSSTWSAQAIGFPQTLQNDTVLVVGYRYNELGVEEWLVRKSNDRGDNWVSQHSPFPSRPEKVPTAVGTWSKSHAHAIGVANNGDIYVVGDGVYWPKRNTSVNYLLVMRSTDGGNTWNEVDRFSYSSKRVTALTHVPLSVACSADGTVWVCGNITTSSQGTLWFVRKGVPQSNGTISWSMSDAFQYTAGQGSGARAVVVLGDGSVLVAGTGADASGREHSLVRRLSTTP